MDRQALSAMVGGHVLKVGGSCAAARTLMYSARSFWSRTSGGISGFSSLLPSPRWAVSLVAYTRRHSDTGTRVSSSSTCDFLPFVPSGDFLRLRAAPLVAGAGAQRCAGADLDKDHLFDRRPSWSPLSIRSPRGCRRDRRSGGGRIRCHASSSGHSAGGGTTTNGASSSSGSEEANYDYDVLTIGAGSGGVRASRFVAGFGAKVAVCELPFGFTSSDSKGGVGGTCVIRGCVPKKLLVYGSQFAHEFLASKGFGWSCEKGPSHDWAALISNKNKEIQRLTGVYRKLLEGSQVHLLEGRAKLVGPHMVEVNSKRYTAKNILLAVGGRPFVPDIPGKEYGITSDEALELPERPQSICIIGGGYIALEFACIFNALGTETHVLIRQPKVLRGFDEEIRDFLGEQLQTSGIKIHNRASPVSVEKDAVSGKLVLRTDKEEKITSEVVMFATGRKPKTERLGAEEVGVELDSLGAIKVDEYSQTTVPSIWAIGDATNRLNLTPMALSEGMAFANTVVKGIPTVPDYRFVPSAVFTQPPIGTVGLTEKDAIKQYGDVDVYTSNFRPMKATLSGLLDRTFMKMVVDAKTDTVVGMHMCGEDAGEIMQGFAVAVKAGITKAQLDSTIGIHPTAAEEFVTMRSPTRKIRQSAAKVLVEAT